MNAPTLSRSRKASEIDLNMMRLPERGDLPATWWALAGIVTYIVLAVVLLGGMLHSGSVAAVPEFFGLGKELNLPVFVLIIGGFLLFVAAAITVFKDIRNIRIEEDDISWVQRHKREGLGLVFAPVSLRESLFKAGKFTVELGNGGTVETLIDDRVRRVHAARLRSDGTAVHVEGLRIIAEKRTARLGSFPRYAASLLLLLAVLGTFAGVKTALPGLIDAVSAAAGEGAGATISAPLRAVADAFGSNALALIGSIAIGLMAQGLAVGRRHLLERLELVSAEYIYGREASASTDPLQAAVQALHRTAEEIHQSTGSLVGIETGLDRLGTRFDAAFAVLEERLAELLAHQESGLYDRTSQAIETLQQRVAELAEVLDANTRLYSGFIDQVGQRSAESREASSQLQGASERLGSALTSIVQLGKAGATSAETVETASRQLIDNTRQVAEQVELLGAAVRVGQPVLDSLQKSVRATAEMVAETDRASRQGWEDVAEALRRKIDQQPVGVAEKRSRLSGGDDSEMLLRIAGSLDRLEAGRLSQRVLFVVPALGITAGLAITFLLWKTSLAVWHFILPFVAS